MPETETITIRVPKALKEGIARIAAEEYRTVSALVILATVEKYPQLKKGAE